MRKIYLCQGKEAVWDFEATEVIVGVRQKPARLTLTSRRTARSLASTRGQAGRIPENSWDSNEIGKAIGDCKIEPRNSQDRKKHSCRLSGKLVTA
jgi:hypothetical protein